LVAYIDDSFALRVPITKKEKKRTKQQEREENEKQKKGESECME
jgi:hypothetical protein